MFARTMREAQEILGVGANADPVEIRAAYVARLKDAHPDAGGRSESVSEIVRAYRSLRARALQKRRHENSLSRPIQIAVRHQRGFQPPAARVSRATWLGRGASVLVLLLAFAAAFYSSSRGQANSDRLGTPETIEMASKTEIEPIDSDAIRDAVSAARQYLESNDAIGLEAHSRRCFGVLTQSPNLNLLDYCLAFDSAATASMTVTGSAASTGTEGFFHPGATSQRHDIALRRALPAGMESQARHSNVEARAASELLLSRR
jgi:curved DNA-binding protein CbpA